MGEDEIVKLTKRINWLNKFGGLAKPIVPKEVLGAFYCLGIPQSMSILRGLQERGATVSDPTQYIKAAIQKANATFGSAAKEELPDDDEEEIMAEAAALADDYEEEAGDDIMAEAAALAEDYDEAWMDEAEPEPKKAKKETTRVVGGITGHNRLVPQRAELAQKRGP